MNYCIFRWQHYSGAPILVECDREATNGNYCTEHYEYKLAEAKQDIKDAKKLLKLHGYTVTKVKK